MTLVRGEDIIEESLWFGNADRPIFGRLTRPVHGQSRGGVLLSPPIGRESRLARRAFRSLAIFLAIDGYVSLRFDHYGTGDSSGSVDDDVLDVALTDSISEGIALLRSFGNVSVSAVGMRMGATIIGAAASKHVLALSSFVMWDPCESGRTYVRELSALGAMHEENLATEPGESNEMIEYPLSAASAKHLSAFTLRGTVQRPFAERVLVVVRDDRPVSGKFRAAWSGEHVDWTATSEQGQLLEAQLPTSVQPVSTISQIRSWLTTSDAPPVPISMPSLTREAVVSHGSSTFAVRESVVELGSRKLFGVLSEPVGESRGPLVVMVNGVNEDHIGPARLWVGLARKWAGMGLRCVRFDICELGESPWLPGQPERPLFDKSRSVDVVESVLTLNPSKPSDTVLVGYCSGAQLALEVALELNPVGVCAINPQVAPRVFRNLDRVENSRHAYVQKLVRYLQSRLNRHRRLKDLVGWTIRFVVSFAYPPKVGSALIKRGSAVLLLLSPEDVPRFQGIPVLRRRLMSSENFRVEVVPGMDHAILSTRGRDRAVTIVNEHIVEKFIDIAATLPPLEEKRV